MIKYIIPLIFIIGCASTIQDIHKTSQPTPLIKSVFKIERYKDTILEGSATAFAVKNEDKSTLILTNEHVCKDYNDEYTLVSYDLARYSAKMLAVHSFADLCLLKVNAILPVPQFSLPQLGEHITSVGAPNGIFAIYESGYVGEPVVVDAFIKGNYIYAGQIVKVKVEEGSSGSPVFNDNNEVVGIVFGTIDGYHSLMMPASVIEEFVANN